MKIKGFELTDWMLCEGFHGEKYYSKGIRSDNVFEAAISSIYIKPDYKMFAGGKLRFMHDLLVKIKATSFDEAKSEVDKILHVYDKLPAFL